jgi:hypothetical protein
MPTDRERDLVFLEVHLLIKIAIDIELKWG